MAAKRKTKPKKITQVESKPQAEASQVSVVAAESVSVVEASIPVSDATDDQKAAAGSQSEQEQAIPKRYDEDDSFSAKKVITWAVGILLLVGILGGAFYMTYQQGIKTGENNIKSQIALTPTPPQASPTPESVETAYEIKILNGSGISGEAAKAQVLLEENDYRVASIGNAKDSTEKTIIQAKSDVNKGWINDLRVVLEVTYDVGEQDFLDESEDIDVVITVGSGKAAP